MLFGQGAREVKGGGVRGKAFRKIGRPSRSYLKRPAPRSTRNNSKTGGDTYFVHLPERLP